MIRIDFHVHTISTDKEKAFEFGLETLSRYVRERQVDAIAITNHNIFDADQFHHISHELSGVEVYPGIEIDVEDGHMLLVADGRESEDFSLRCQQVNDLVMSGHSSLSVGELQEIFNDLSKYILIPHYLKKPRMGEKTLSQLRKFITAGEVSSPKKFLQCLRNDDHLVPVFFSDSRMSVDTTDFSTQQTYIDAEEPTFSAIRFCLRDKHKVFLDELDGHQFFEALPGGFRLSTGLNVVLGERSSGKTYTLDRISERFENVKYVRQFSLLERDSEQDAHRFEELLNRGQSLATSTYLETFRSVVDDMASVDLDHDDRRIGDYLNSVLQSAQHVERADLFSNTRLFGESGFREPSIENLGKLVESVDTLIQNAEFREIIDQYVPQKILKKLAMRLMSEYTSRKETGLKMRWLNDVIDSIKRSLKLHTSAPEINDVDFYGLALNKQKVQRFREIVTVLRREKTIQSRDIQGFKMVARVMPFTSAQELKTKSGKVLKFRDAFANYDDPYEFLKALRDIDGLEEAEYYRFFAKVEYRILNRYGFEVSGGERSEFRLLQEIADAQNYDMLLIDEPESSFDNLFLRGEVNSLIREMAKTMPVVIVTHNSTVGASVLPDFVVYTKRNIDGTRVSYTHFSGQPHSNYLISPTGEKMRNFEVLMNCLEAGFEAYSERRDAYEVLKD